MKDKQIEMRKIEIIEMAIAKKNLRSSLGDVNLDVPRDRKAEFEPQIIKKYETVCNELDKKKTYIIHQIRNSIKYIASKDKKGFMRDLKEVYRASTEELALAQLDNLKDK